MIHAAGDDKIGVWMTSGARFETRKPRHSTKRPITGCATRLPAPPGSDYSSRCCSTTPQSVADLGCSTGTLTILLARAGHHVHGIDFSPQMLPVGRSKAVERWVCPGSGSPLIL